MRGWCGIARWAWRGWRVGRRGPGRAPGGGRRGWGGGGGGRGARPPKGGGWGVGPELEARVCELGRAHPKWGALRIVHELMRGPVVPEPMPSRATVHRILVRHGLVIARPRRRKPSDYVRWQRPAAMQLWQLDIIYGSRLVGVRTGELRRADRDRRRRPLALLRTRAGSRARDRLCDLPGVLGGATALWRAEEVLTDNGKQFHRSLRPRWRGAVRKICRRNGIA